MGSDQGFAPFQYALFNPGRGSIWYLTGMAMRQCIEYGYHHEVLQHSSNANPLEIDMKRRLFWTTYKVFYFLHPSTLRRRYLNLTVLLVSSSTDNSASTSVDLP